MCKVWCKTILHVFIIWRKTKLKFVQVWCKTRCLFCIIWCEMKWFGWWKWWFCICNSYHPNVPVCVCLTCVPQTSSLSPTAVNLFRASVFFLRSAVFLSAASELNVPIHVVCPCLLIRPVSWECVDCSLWFLLSLSLCTSWVFNP